MCLLHYPVIAVTQVFFDETNDQSVCLKKLASALNEFSKNLFITNEYDMMNTFLAK
jgi:hypothetical protein